MYDFTKKRALELGFELCGVAEAGNVEPEVVASVEQWIESGSNASLSWMERNKELRYNPTLFPEVATRSVVVCGLSYHTRNTLSDHPIARYAHAADYHFVIKGMLTTLQQDMEQELGATITARAFSDSAPILERYWAVKAGLGWIGRNTMVVNREIGSYFLIGVLLVDMEFDRYDTADSFNGCGECHRCIDSCKSRAITENKQIECDRCLSYITIEHRGEYSEQQKGIINLWEGSSIFGCDTCLKACPWNIRAAKHLTVEQSTRREQQLRSCTLPPELSHWEGLTPSAFKKQYATTPLSRAGHKKILSTIAALSDKEE